MYDLEKVRCWLYRGGTSRGVFLLSEDVPDDPVQQEKMFLGVMGSPDVRQIDGLGGATSHTSKVAVIHPSPENGVDIGYEFIQVGIDRPHVDRRGMCGNLLSAAGLFAVDQGLVESREPETEVVVKNTVTGMGYRVRVPVKDGRSLTQGDYHISGVARPGAAITVEFIDPAGSVTGRLLPTNNVRDEFETDKGRYTVSIVDSGHLHVLARAEDFRIQGNESLSELKGREGLMVELEHLRGLVAQRCGFVDDPAAASVQSPARPRICLVHPPIGYSTIYGDHVLPGEMDVRAITVSMERFHQSIPLSTTICVASAMSIPETTVHEAGGTPADVKNVRMGHPSGITEVEVDAAPGSPTPEIRKVRAWRTARRLMEGYAYYPA